MYTSLRIATSGMTASQRAIDVIGNNVGNLNTLGYRKGRANFHEVVQGLGINAEDPEQFSPKLMGTDLKSIQRFDTQGSLFTTGRSLDVAIQGEGFFTVQGEDGQQYLSRDGGLKVDVDGALLNSISQRILPPTTIPAGAANILITRDGVITGDINGANVRIGRLQLSTVKNAAGLEELSAGTYRTTPASGDATVAPVGSEEAGTLVPSAREGSNVDMADEMSSLLVARRAYAMSAKAVQTIDEMMQSGNNVNN